MCCCEKVHFNCRLNAAQGLAIAGFVFSFPMAVFFFLIRDGIWIGVFMLILNIVGLVLFQIPWCCRRGKGFLYTAGTLAILNSLSMLAVGISMASFYAAVMASHDDAYVDVSITQFIICAICVVGAICWAVAASQIIVFVGSGQHAEWEWNESPSNVPNTAPFVTTNTDPPVVDLEASVVPVIEKVVLPQPNEIVELSPLASSASDPIASSTVRDEPAPKPKLKKSETKKSESKKSESKKPKKYIYKDDEIRILNPEYKEWKKARKKDEQKLLAVVSI